MIIGSVEERTVGPHVVEGANTVPGRPIVTIYVTEEDTSVTAFRNRTDLSNIEFQVRREKGSWAVAMLPAIQEADVAIVIGGGSGTVGIAYSTRALKKPVLAIPSFKGAAKEIWDISLHDYETRYGVTPGEIETLREAWGGAAADVTVRVAEKLVKRNPFRSNVPHVAMLCSVFVMTGLWVALFLRSFGLSNDLTFFLLLGIAALLGTGLHSSLRLRRGEVAQLTARDLLSGATIGILLAFGLALLYLAGGIVLTGKYVTLGSPEDFTRIAVSMSVLGLAAGFLLDSTAENLRRRLEGLTSQ